MCDGRTAPWHAAKPANPAGQGNAKGINKPHPSPKANDADDDASPAELEVDHAAPKFQLESRALSLMSRGRWVGRWACMAL